MEALETWKDIPGLDGRYQVSNIGRVRSSRRKGTTGGIVKATVNRQYR